MMEQWARPPRGPVARVGYLETWAPAAEAWERNYFVLAGAELECYVPKGSGTETDAGWGTSLVEQEHALGGGDANQAVQGLELAAVLDLHQGEWVDTEEDNDARQATQRAPRDQLKRIFCVGCDVRDARGLQYKRVTVRAQDKKAAKAWMDEIQRAVFEANANPPSEQADGDGSEGAEALSRTASAATDSTGGSELVRRGFLMKKGGTFHRYSKRYFVLGPGPRMAYYYRLADVGVLAAAGTTDLTGAMVYTRPDKKTKFAFHGKRATWCLQASSAEEADEWMASIMRAAGQSLTLPRPPSPAEEGKRGDVSSKSHEGREDEYDSEHEDSEEGDVLNYSSSPAVAALHARVRELEEVVRANVAAIDRLMARAGLEAGHDDPAAAPTADAAGDKDVHAVVKVPEQT